jgi:3-deoxy-manno-octulosonate cytidylyltransferase (CMP-KDO synthetase)
VPAIQAPAGVIAVIPARYASTRLPAKALADIVVATDDERIREAAARIGEVVMTSALHTSGSDRVAEVAATSDCEIVVNVQGDLPLLEPRWIDLLVERMAADPSIGMATVAVPVRRREELADPNVVKVVCDAAGRALYFSRAPIPFHRDDAARFDGALHHVGLYAYRRETLLRFATLAPTPLEETEKLENGIGIGVVVIDDPPPLEVDTPADLERARRAVLVSSN